MSEKSMTFEKTLARLEEIAARLGEDIELDEMLELYEEGVKLSKACMEKLDKAEVKFKELKAASGTQEEE